MAACCQFMIAVIDPVDVRQFHGGKAKRPLAAAGNTQNGAEITLALGYRLATRRAAAADFQRHDAPFHQSAIMRARRDLLPDIASLLEIDGAKPVEPCFQHQRPFRLQVDRALRHTGGDAHRMPLVDVRRSGP